ncbi:MAG: SUF system Fe-S cluster assembly regulator [Myxococcota bacterium]
MLRISKLTDYAIVLASHLANAEGPWSSPRLACETNLPKPTVAKILKALCRAGLVSSTRGVTGGYTLARSADAISVGALIEAIEGPIAVTECTDDHAETPCILEGDCGLQANWQRINDAVSAALDSIPLSAMAGRSVLTLVQLRTPDSASAKRT